MASPPLKQARLQSSTKQQKAEDIVSSFLSQRSMNLSRNNVNKLHRIVQHGSGESVVNLTYQVTKVLPDWDLETVAEFVEFVQDKNRVHTPVEPYGHCGVEIEIVDEPKEANGVLFIVATSCPLRLYVSFKCADNDDAGTLSVKEVRVAMNRKKLLLNRAVSYFERLRHFEKFRVFTAVFTDVTCCSKATNSSFRGALKSQRLIDLSRINDPELEKRNVGWSYFCASSNDRKKHYIEKFEKVPV